MAILKALVAFLPWLMSMYTLYWLDYGNIWSYETPHRGKISVAILVIGMAVSFILYSRFFGRRKVN